MSNMRYTDELKAEEIGHILERGYSVAEIARLKAELRRTQEERDILKKAYFANQPG